MKPAKNTLLLFLTTTALHAQEADPAQKLANPISDLISLPIQSNYDFGVGPGDGTIWKTNIQPVIPISISDDWNVVSRTILPVIDQEGLAPAGDSLDESGLGDITQSFFFSPKPPTTGPTTNGRCRSTFRSLNSSKLAANRCRPSSAPATTPTNPKTVPSGAFVSASPSCSRNKPSLT